MADRVFLMADRVFLMADRVFLMGGPLKNPLKTQKPQKRGGRPKFPVPGNRDRLFKISLKAL